jgi:ankyrin repeat protein
MAATAALSALAAPAAAQIQGAAEGYNFLKAVRDADGDKAQQALQGHTPGLVNYRDSDGSTPLTVTIARSDETWTAFLLRQGADPNLPGKGGDTPLIFAARVGFDEAVEWLLEVGAKVDNTNRSGETPLIVAVQQRQPRIAQMLLQAGADPDKADHAAGYSARDYAKRDPRARDILALIEAKSKAQPAKTDKPAKLDDFKLK